MTVSLWTIGLVFLAFMLGRLSTRWTLWKPADTMLQIPAMPRVSRTGVVTTDASLAGAGIGRGREDERLPMTLERGLMLGFVVVWMVPWSFAIVLVLGTVLSGADEAFVTLFLLCWALLAMIGWVHAAITVYRLVMGKPVTMGRSRSI